MSQDFVRSLGGSTSGLGRKLASEHVLHLDVQLLILLGAIVGYGLLVLYSAVEQQTAPVMSQAVKISVAFAVMAVLAQLSPIVYLRLAPWLYAASLILLVLVLFYGHTVNGSQRWLRVPGVLTLQPSELMKIVMPMMLAWYFHEL